MDFLVGQDALVPIDVRNLLTGVPLSLATVGAWSFYGPLSTTPVATGTGAFSRGGGVFTILATAAQVSTPGTYTLEYAVTAPPEAVGTFRQSFSVGTPVEGAWRMWDLLVSIIRGTGGTVRKSTNINATIVTDAFLGGNMVTVMEGSELILIDPVTNYAEWFTSRVTSFNDTTGAMTLLQDTGLVSDTSGRYYAITAPRGFGFSFERILDELLNAYEILPITQLGSVSVGIETSNALELALPGHLQSVTAVAVRDRDAPETMMWDDLTDRYEVLADRRLLRLDEGLGLGPGYTLRVSGAVKCELPRLGGSWTDVRGAYLRNKVRHGLFSTSDNPNHMRAAQVIFTDLVQHGSPYRRLLPGEIKLR